MHCVACGYCRRRDLISLGCIHLPVPLNCAWGVLSDGPYNAADVVNLLKTSVRKGDTEEDVEWRSVMHWASTGQPLFQQQESPDQAADADTSESQVEEVSDPQTPKPKGKTDKQRHRLSASCGSKRRHGSGNVKRRRRRRRKRPKRTSKQIARGKNKRINWLRQPLRHPHRREKGQSRASRLPCNVVSRLAYPRATARATASDWRPHVPLDHECRWTIPDKKPLTQSV